MREHVSSEDTICINSLPDREATSAASQLSFPQAKRACLSGRQVGSPSEMRERFRTSQNDKIEAECGLNDCPTKCPSDLRTWRRFTQVAFVLLIFLIPVLNIFRYDSDSRELIFLGQVWSLSLKQGFYADQTIHGSAHVAVHFLLKAILPWIIVISIFPLLGFFSGRFFCGWLCPEGALFELSDHLTLRLLGRRSLFGKKANDPEVGRNHRAIYGIIALLCLAVIPLAGGIALTGYLVTPKTIWRQMLNRDFTPGVKAGILGVSIYMLIGSVFVRHAFCKYVCAAGLMQTLFGWISPLSLRLKFNSRSISKCTDCRQCDKACFMDVMPRKNRRDISCVNCGACIAACSRELGPDNGLFYYSFGESPRPCPGRAAVHNAVLGRDKPDVES